MIAYQGPVYVPSPHHAGSTNIGNGADFSGALVVQNPTGAATIYDPITAASLTSVTPSDLTCSAPTIAKGVGGDATALVFALSGGTAGTIYELMFAITTVAGQKFFLTVWVRCQ